MPFRNTMLAALLAGAQCVVGFSALAGAPDAENPAATTWPTQSWAASTPEEQGVDSAGLARLIEIVGTRRQDSLMIVRHGKIIAEAYYAPYVAGVSHDLRSVTKGVTGTLTAIALRDGFFDSVDHPVVDYFSDRRISNLDDNKKALTIRHLLNMTSGIDWLENVHTPDEPLIQMYNSPDRTGFVLNRPMSGAPGSKFYYNSGNPYLLSALLTKTTGQSAFDFAKHRLFDPLGITSAKWGDVDAQGVTDGEAGLSLSPHDMARIGYLYLHNGMWDGKQIIPPSWVDRAREGNVTATYGFRYGNFWWSLPEKGAYMAQGRHSQLILVLPKLDIVAVMTGVMPDDEFYPARRMIDDISRSVKSDTPLAPDPVAQSVLAASIRAAAIEKHSPIGATPELAKAVSGKTWQFAKNDLDAKSFSLNLVGENPTWEIVTDTGKPDKPTERFSGPLGLDGIFRKSPAHYGIDAVKGRWINARTFAMERRILGNSETQLWELTFDGNKMTVNYEDTDGTKVELHGEASD
ncbi:MAG TPA: serine hydrolase [Bradyrhizobium sp.]|nr:serine hydrolase [Bradyrhizobium sp.]